MESQDLRDQIDAAIVDFGLRLGSDTIYELGASRQAERHLKTPAGLRQQTALNFRAATRAKFAELGFRPPAYEVKEFEVEKRDAWRLRIDDVANGRCYELDLSPDRLDPKRWNIHAAAYGSRSLLTIANRLDEWKGSLVAGGEDRPYLEAINASAMVLSWLDPMAAPEVTVSGSGGWATPGVQ